MWKTVKLGDVVEYVKKNAEGSGLPYVGLENISSETMKILGDIEVPESTSTTFEFDETQVLYGRLRPYLKKVLAPNFKGQCSTEIFCLKPKANLLRGYLAYWLIEPKIAEAIERTSTGARMPRANMNALLGFDFLLPPLVEQQRIVAKLDAAFAEIDCSIENTQKSIELAEVNLGGLIDAKTSNREGWEKIRLGDLGLVQTGNTPMTSNKENFGNDFPFVKPPHFRKDGSIDIKNDGLSFAGAKASRTASANSVLMVCIGATIGKVGVCKEDVCFNQQINSLTPKKGYDAELIYWQMKGSSFQQSVKRKAGQATLPIISKSKWQELIIYLPKSYDEQVKIRQQLRDLSESTDEYINYKTIKLSQLNKLKSAILAQELQPRNHEAA